MRKIIPVTVMVAVCSPRQVPWACSRVHPPACLPLP